jgi:hypothetical protein
MLTHCSHCKKPYSISISELRSHSGTLYCPHCDEMLSRLKFFNPNIFARHPQRHQRHNLGWGLALVAGLGLLAGQFYQVEGKKMMNNKQLRNGLERVCVYLSCQLPVYKNLEDFEVLQGDLQRTANNEYIFQAVISNQAEFEQAYPRIKLSLLDFNGQIFAQRIFYPLDYHHPDPKDFIPAAETVEMSLAIAPPAQKVGGYTFELM